MINMIIKMIRIIIKMILRIIIKMIRMIIRITMKEGMQPLLKAGGVEMSSKASHGQCICQHH